MTGPHFHCPPYSARLTAADCAAIKALAVDAANHPKREGSTAVLLSKRSCIDCPGVKALAKMWRLEPSEIDVSKLRPPRSFSDRDWTSKRRDWE